jgi:hypothetical protein
MKGTAIALVIVATYWIVEGFRAMADSRGRALAMIGAGVLLFPLARYCWRKTLSRRPTPR